MIRRSKIPPSKNGSPYPSIMNGQSVCIYVEGLEDYFDEQGLEMSLVPSTTKNFLIDTIRKTVEIEAFDDE